MGEEAPLTWIAQYGEVGGWAGMVGLTLILFTGLATSWLYTRRQHESIVTLYREESAKKDKIIEQQAAQISALLEGSGAAKDFFEKVPVTTAPVPMPNRRRKPTPIEEAKR